jgi:hypothetical protein
LIEIGSETLIFAHLINIKGSINVLKCPANAIQACA